MNLEFINQELEQRYKIASNIEVLLHEYFKVDPNKPSNRVRKGQVHEKLGIVGDWKLERLANTTLVQMGAEVVKNRGRFFFNGVSLRESKHGK